MSILQSERSQFGEKLLHLTTTNKPQQQEAVN